MDLLAKTRKINAMLQKTAGKPVNFKEMAETISEVIECKCICCKPTREITWLMQ